VHAPQDAAPRARLVVLQELVVHAEVAERRLAIGLLKEAARVAVQVGLDEHGTLQAGLKATHSGGG
jgi:hypothetical protein